MVGAACSGVLLLAVAMLLANAPRAESTTVTARASLRAALAEQGMGPLGPAPAQPEALVALGHMLFFDPELSGNRNISCATCHHPGFGAGDALSVSFGSGGVGLGTTRTLADGALIPRNAPEVFNRGDTGWHSMFWDSRVEVVDGVVQSPAGAQLPAGFTHPLAVQAMFPVTSREEMRGQPGDVAADGRVNELAAFGDEQFTEIWQGLTDRLLAIPEYVALFEAAYPDLAAEDIGFQHTARAIAAFEAQAFTFTDSPWDRWLAGEDAALNDLQIRGAELFYGDAGCATCHSGTLMTDQRHYNIGAPQVGPGRGASAPLDFGRQLVTHAPGDLFAFRTPPLRNVALTGPWMHNGAFHSLEQTVRHHFAPELCWSEHFTFDGMEPELAELVHRTESLRRVILATVDPGLPDFQPKDGDVAALVAFLEGLSSPSMADLDVLVPASVPSGLPLDTVRSGGY